MYRLVPAQSKEIPKFLVLVYLSKEIVPFLRILNKELYGSQSFDLFLFLLSVFLSILGIVLMLLGVLVVFL